MLVSQGELGFDMPVCLPPLSRLFFQEGDVRACVTELVVKERSWGCFHVLQFPTWC